MRSSNHKTPQFATSSFSCHFLLLQILPFSTLSLCSSYNMKTCIQNNIKNILLYIWIFSNSRCESFWLMSKHFFNHSCFTHLMTCPSQCILFFNSNNLSQGKNTLNLLTYQKWNEGECYGRQRQGSFEHIHYHQLGFIPLPRYSQQVPLVYAMWCLTLVFVTLYRRPQAK